MRYRRLLPLALGAALLATACGARTNGDGDPKIVAAFYPLAWLAGQVAGPDATVQNLTKPGAEPHDLELTPRQVIDVGEARLAFYIRGVQPAVDKAVREHAKKHSLDAASLVKTLPAPQDEADHSAEDPHLWLDPSRFATVATALGERLAAIDASHAAEYRSRAAQVVTKLTALDAEFRTGLRDCARKEIVTSHSAFGYLAARYGLTQVGVTGLDPEAEPSPARLASLTQLVRRTGATTVFTETLMSPKTAATLAAEAGVRTQVLDPVEGVKAGSSDDYFSIMRRDLATLRPALGCR
ncbi:metal ABC transporter substrate-binding protein [Actinoallomurus purpureus]|uniref:metal ABC transporter substrate-binding protein n=1 Tax=Actinoallomurus purpureus TaxID=478114 RepID=UPI002091FB7B|nr:metal ABC transporter substrate-binding protein [Actinoallomurus purpureus]MCO6006309.1 metal ABC transporter substrate-binding protein [Actinoallomurus purpureus]